MIIIIIIIIINNNNDNDNNNNNNNNNLFAERECGISIMRNYSMTQGQWRYCIGICQPTVIWLVNNNKSNSSCESKHICREYTRYEQFKKQCIMRKCLTLNWRSWSRSITFRMVPFIKFHWRILTFAEIQWCIFSRALTISEILTFQMCDPPLPCPPLSSPLLLSPPFPDICDAVLKKITAYSI